MVVVRALRRVPGALASNPVLFVVFGAFALLQVPQLLLQSVNPVLAGLVSLGLTGVTLLVAPFVQAGTLQMADEALAGRTSVGSFFAAGRSYYLSVLGAYLVVFGVSVVLGVVGFVVALFGGVLAFAEPGGIGGVGLLLVLGVGGVVLLAYLAFAFFVQFYGQEIVLDGASALGGLRASAGLVADNLLSTLGYFLVVLVGSLAVGGGLGLASVFLTDSGVGAAPPSLSFQAGYAVVFVLVVAVLTSFYTVFAVSFWRELRGGSGASDAR